jgi:circadian clock protein KaiB
MNKSISFKFRLYVAGEAANSTLRSLCREILDNRSEIEIVDVLREPKRALEDGVLLTPMLVKLYPAPIRKIIGNLSQREPILQALGLPL